MLSGLKFSYVDVIEELLQAEGLWVDDPDDKGGATMRGITLKSYCAYLGRDVSKDELRDLSKEDAVKFYKGTYWDGAKVDTFSDELKHLWMDMSVNHGKRNAGKILQQSVNTKENANVLDVDGIVGSGTYNEIGILGIKDVLVERAVFFVNNIFDGSRYLKRTPQAKFIRGWFFHRVFHFLTYPLEVVIRKRDAEIEVLNERVKELENA
tara:strand:- start:530 stop:1156 length:627 start_codon:yes stop_codon:yes gene_type:complete